jgi:hypothetical protein
MKRKIVRKVIEGINPNIQVAFRKGDNKSDILSQKIFLSLGKNWLDDTMSEHLQEIYKVYPIAKTVSPEAFIILHEVGHIESVKNYHTERVGAMLSKYSRQVEKISSSNAKYRLLSRRYIKLELENRANVWACNYIQKNPNIVRELEKAF